MPRHVRGALPPGPPLLAGAQTLLIWSSPFAFLSRCRRRYGSRFTTRITSHPPLVFLSHPADVSEMLVAPPDVLHPGEGASTIEPLVGDRSFMLCEGNEHLSGRRSVLPAFHQSAVQAHAGLVAELAGRELATWPRGVAVSLHQHLRALTLQTLLRTSFDGPGPSGDRLSELRGCLLEMLTVTASAVLPEPLLRHGIGRRTWARFLRRRGSVDKLIYSIIEDRGRAGRADDLLDRLLRPRSQNRWPPSPRQVRDDLMSIVLAGHETTASELAWAFQLLAHNPQVQRRLREELDAGVGEAYLTATIQEVLRHRPVFLFAIPRAVKQPIEIGDWTYRPPAQLLACIYLLHHDPDVYPEPDRFLPERFLQGTPPPPLWLPWGGGRKRCPGQHLAMLEMKTVLRTVLAHATVLPVRNTIERPRWRSVIVTPHRGCEVILRPRHRKKSVATRH